MKYLVLLIAAVALGGCGHIPVTVDAAVVPRDPSVQTPCDLVPPSPARGSSFGEVYTFSQTMVGLYGECALRDQAKGDWIESQGH